MNMLTRLYVSGLGLLTMTCAILPAEAFSLTGTYKGVVACNSTTAGKASSRGWNIELLIVQDGKNLRVD
ncbi:hypothetical protein ABVF61_05440 [Roseibium sp. HPY-6]|uniref:hypothetical protein n=1 Tax=Roseibium sp. HPY-6 TaxID=3229852 RepID=UPI00338E974B